MRKQNLIGVRKTVVELAINIIMWEFHSKVYRSLSLIRIFSKHSLKNTVWHFIDFTNTYILFWTLNSLINTEVWTDCYFLFPEKLYDIIISYSFRARSFTKDYNLFLIYFYCTLTWSRMTSGTICSASSISPADSSKTLLLWRNFTYIVNYFVWIQWPQEGIERGWSNTFHSDQR